MALGLTRWLHRVVGRLDGRNVASASALTNLGLRREAHLVRTSG